MKNLIKSCLPIADVLAVPLILGSGLILKTLRKTGVQRMPLCRDLLIHLGVFPVADHYYEPRFDYRKLATPLSQERNLPGIKWNIDGQLEFLSTLTYQDELKEFPVPKKGASGYRGENESFGSGDAEYWYQVVRALKPSRIIEIGSGNSTLVAVRALEKNRELDPAYHCDHICIEPYEMPWLEDLGVQVVREKVEDVGVSIFQGLGENDILFIDSSHVIRPQGDVLFEYLELLPTLRKGVVVHIHDIFSPRDYLDDWLRCRVKFWNEQYLLEAFLSNNEQWKIIGAVNYLWHHYRDSLMQVAPFLSQERNPGSFYIRKVV